MVTDWISDNIIEIFGAVAGIAYVILEIKRNILLWPLGIITSAVYIYVFGHSGFYANMGLQVYYLVISLYGWYKWHEGHKEHNVASRRKQEGSDHAAVRPELKPKVQSDESSLLSVGDAGRLQKGQSDADASVSAGDDELRLKVLTREGVPVDISDLEPASDVIRIDWITAVICFITAMVIWGFLWFVLDRWTDSPVPLWDGMIASFSVVATWMLTRKYIEQWYVWIVANAIAMIVYFVSGMYPTAVLFFIYFVMAIIGLMSWNRPGAE
jgi:nicotinamide mononucleotide transporter